MTASLSITVAAGPEQWALLPMALTLALTTVTRSLPGSLTLSDCDRCWD